MPDMALEVVTVQATAPGSSASFLAVSGNSLTIRDSKEAKLISIWNNRESDGFFRLTSPLLHDAIVGINSRANKDGARHTGIVHLGFPQMLTPQDTLTATGGGSGSAGVIETSSFLVMYQDLAGICGKLIDTAELKNRGVELYDSQTDITSGTAGGYSGSILLNSQEDQLKANMDYAILGHTMEFNEKENFATVRWTSPDWGNLGIGAPGIAVDTRATSNFFIELSNMMNMPTIPVFNASQKTSVFIDVAAEESATTVNVITHMVRLKDKVTSKRRK